MRFELSAAANRLISEFSQEVLRWNDHINLVSRQNAPEVVRNLGEQCRLGLGLIWRVLAPEPGLTYFDLGSGAGFPGIIWNIALADLDCPARTTLIEPRQKRAWFLTRLRSLPGMPPFSVGEGRWGEVATKSLDDESEQVLVSLKALRLTDQEVLKGLAADLGGGANPPGKLKRVSIARFIPPERDLDEELQGELGLPKHGAAQEDGGIRWIRAEVSVIGPAPGPAPVRVLLSDYRFD